MTYKRDNSETALSKPDNYDLLINEQSLKNLEKTPELYGDKR
jgi:hypothetical protein